MRFFGVTDCHESCSTCVVTKGLFWETTGEFVFLTCLFLHDFLPQWGTGWASPGGSAAEMPILSEHSRDPSAVTQVSLEGFWTRALPAGRLEGP